MKKTRGRLWVTGIRKEKEREKVREMMRVTKERLTRKWSVKRSVMVLGPSSFLLYER